jgi:hypothetical protein
MIGASVVLYRRTMKLLALLPILVVTGTQPIDVTSPVALRGHGIPVSVSGLQASAVEARAAGATRALGKALPWTSLTYDGRAWVGVLPPPELRGVYQVELRIDHRAAVVRSPQWLVRVFARGTSSRPTFATPEGVAASWVRELPSHPRLVASRRWPLPTFDRRSPRLHQLVVVAYRLAGGPRLGMFVTAVRDDPSGRWRLLEATVTP